MRLFPNRVTMLTIAPVAVLASLLVTGITISVRTWGGLQPLELAAYDALVRLNSSEEPDPRLLVVAITEADIQGKNRWPLSDQTLADVINQLQRHNPRVIGLDLHRNVPQPPGTAALEKAFKADNLIAIEKLGNPLKDGIPAPPSIPKQRIGFNDFLVDPDGIIRRNLLYAYTGDKQFYSFSLRVALTYLSQEGYTLRVTPTTLAIGNVNLPLLKRQSGSYNNLDALGYQVMIDYQTPQATTRELTVTQVLQGEFDPTWVRDKVVLIGSTAPSLKDLFSTPYSSQAHQDSDKVPGVYLHAQLTRQILSAVLEQHPIVWYWSDSTEMLWIWMFALIGGLLAWRFQHPLILGLMGAAAISSIVGICMSVFAYAGWIPLVPPILTLIMTMGSVVAYRSFYQTYYDPLSGLPNRTLLIKILRETLSQAPSPTLAILFLGLDRFEVIHNSLGHQASDQLIVEVTYRLNRLSCLRRSHTLARIGDDEFVVLLPSLADIDEPLHIADQLHQAMAPPFILKEQQVFTGVSIGIALNQVGTANRPEDLLRDARTAMNRARQQGSDRHEVFAAGMHVQMVRQLQLETDLRRAIEQQQFQLYYQPIIALANHQLAGFEALIRWHHPQHGFIAPSEFIPVAEETGLIIPLGQWILHEACQQLKTWQMQFPNYPALTVSVNLSSQQLNQLNLVDQVEAILHQVGSNGQGLKLEITESVAMSDAEATIALLQQLKALNLRLSIDDFGTGYSSLSYLHRFPVDTLKIDRSFINQIGDSEDDATIVQTILVLGHTLGMDIVAEGVETIAQQQILQKLHCEYGQGYLFSKPIDSKTATQLLHTYAQPHKTAQEN